MNRSLVCGGFATAIVWALSACVVVPLDPRTGQPYPYLAAPAESAARTTVVMPPAPAPAAPPHGDVGQRGIANAFGAKGVNAQCEYVIAGPALGTGVYLFSDGAKYQLHFGG